MTSLTACRGQCSAEPRTSPPSSPSSREQSETLTTPSNHPFKDKQVQKIVAAATPSTD